MNGKLPPQSLDLEEAVIGALMIEKRSYDVICDIISPDHFYKDSHGLIFKAIIELQRKGEPIDILTVTNQLRLNGTLEICGGPYYITQLTNRVASAANIEFHARIIQQKFIQRELIRIAGEIHREAFEETTDIYELIDRADSEIQALLLGDNTIEAYTIGELHYETIQEQERRMAQGEVPIEYPTGNHYLDQATGGWQRGELILIGGRPGSGKTSRAVSFALTAAFHKKETMFFELEVKRHSLSRKTLSNLSNVSGNKYKRSTFTDEDMSQMIDAAKKSFNLPLYIVDISKISVRKIKNSVRKQEAKTKKKIDLIIVDYIQLMEGSEETWSREREVAGISTGLKQLARELDIPIIALAQLSRGVDSRSNKRPLLSDLKDSGSLEADADMVMFIYRPSYYYSYGEDVKFDEDHKEYYSVDKISKEDYKRVLELDIKKFRNGPPDNFLMELFLYDLNQFQVYEPQMGGNNMVPSELPKATQGDLALPDEPPF